MNFVLSKGIPVISSLKYGIFHGVLPNYNIPLFAGIICSEKFSLSAICQRKRTRSEIARYKALDIVDWLPFQWSRRKKFNPFETSGDLVQTLEYDPSWPKPDFELSEELKTASDDVKYMFTLVSASKAEIKEAIKRRTLERVQRHPNDFESLEVTIALKTIAIRSVFEHQREHKKERKGGRFVLDKWIKKRNKMLKNLRNIDMDRFNWLCQELKVTYTPHKLGGIKERYTRKWDLRQLTKQYCKNLMNERKAAYHEELKRQQEDFLKEKEEILAFIEKEEKELANLTIDK